MKIANQMKKITVLMLVLMMAAVLAACGGKSGSGQSGSASGGSSSKESGSEAAQSGGSGQGNGADSADKTASAGGGSADSADQAAGEEDGQNPIMNYVGPYTNDRALMLVEADGMDGVKIHVSWGSSVTQNSEWEMTGTFDMDTRTVTYKDGVRIDYVYEENGTVKSEEKAYTDGTGKIVFSEGEDLTLTWTDDKEHCADNMIFRFSPMEQ